MRRPLLRRDKVNPLLYICALLADDEGIVLHAVEAQYSICSEYNATLRCVGPPYLKSDQE